MKTLVSSRAVVLALSAFLCSQQVASAQAALGKWVLVLGAAGWAWVWQTDEAQAKQAKEEARLKAIERRQREIERRQQEDNQTYYPD